MPSALEVAARELGAAVERFALALAEDGARRAWDAYAAQAAVVIAERRFLSVGDAAERSQHHPVTVRRALEAGELHGTQSGSGGRWTMQATCLDAWAVHERCEHQKARAT